MARQWYIIQDNKKYGPYSEERIRSFIGEGRLRGNALVWCEGMTGWARAADVEPFRSHFAVPQARPAERPAPSARPTITSKRHGGGRKIAAVGALVVVVIIAGLGVWWIYPRLSGQPQSGQASWTEPSFEVKGTLYTARENGIHDGDTIYVLPMQANQDIVNEIYWDWEWVRFSGGIDAPEIDPPQPGANEAKSLVKQLIASGGNMIYLDLDNLAISNTGKRFRDKRYDRLLAVVYVRIGGKLVNVNAEVLRWGQANYPNHNWLKYRHYTSEFNPDEWLDPGYPYVS